MSEETAAPILAQLPLLALRDRVVLPGERATFTVGRGVSLTAIDVAQKKSQQLMLVTQLDGSEDTPTLSRLYSVGVVANVEEVTSNPGGTVDVNVLGVYRAKLVQDQEQEGPNVVVEVIQNQEVDPSTSVQRIMREIKAVYASYTGFREDLGKEGAVSAEKIAKPGQLADAVLGSILVDIERRMKLLRIVNPVKRLEWAREVVHTELKLVKVQAKVKKRLKQKEFDDVDLRSIFPQGKPVKREREPNEDVVRYRELLSGLTLPEHALAKVDSELQRLEKMNPFSSEASVVRNYLDWVLAVPWLQESGAAPSLSEAGKVLDAQHHGLDLVKERVLEFLAVGQRVGHNRGPILCLVGPPGVGKTSLGHSIADAMGRPFVRISLGGTRDEAEIRGHRRTYIGAMPGKLIHAMKRAGVCDPVIILDEIDKMSSDFRGDPASALLEVLDPEQNNAFTDHFLDLDYDLSRVTFVCTANTIQGIPLALRDRLEVQKLSGYVESEKLAIAQKYLLPRQLELHGLGPDELVVTTGAIKKSILLYTQESGVRELERQLAKVCRRVVRKLIDDPALKSQKVTALNVQRYLGVAKHRPQCRDLDDQVGVVHGLAVSPWGGEVLDIEVASVEGKGSLILTGRLGDWLKESATAAHTYVRSRVDVLGLDATLFSSTDLHIHYPGNALKTDGPSAGVAMTTAIVSALTGVAVSGQVAMTGEVSLRGRVLRIGGLKEKVLAAYREGMERVLIPEGNRDQIEEIPAEVLNKVDVIPVSHMDQVLKLALVSVPSRATALSDVESEVPQSAN